MSYILYGCWYESINKQKCGEKNHVIVHLYTHTFFSSFNVQVPHPAVFFCRSYLFPHIHLIMDYTSEELETLLTRIDDQVQTAIMEGQIEKVVADVGSELVSQRNIQNNI